jgi:fatty acid desaturase
MHEAGHGRSVTTGEEDMLQQDIKLLSCVEVRRSVYHLCEIWGVIGLVCYGSGVLMPLSSGIPGYCVYLLAIAIIASRQHALMVITHDGIHKRLSRKLKVNDGLARYVAAFSVFISLAKWRFIHLYHHQYTYTAQDPDRAIFARYPLARHKFVRLLLCDICGLNVFSTLKYFIDFPFGMADFNRRFLGQEREQQYQQVSDMSAFLIFWSVLLVGPVWMWGSSAIVWFVFYWLVPYCTFTQVFFRLRGAIEHGNVPDPQNLYLQTRTYFIHPFFSFFFAPKHVNYHLEHHLYPSVPFYNLPQLHAKLRQTMYVRNVSYCEDFAVSLQKLIQ